MYDHKLQAGESIKLETVITGQPAPTVEWQRNGKPLKSGDNGVKITLKDQSIHALVIDSVGHQHDGDYTVKAQNVSGSVQTSANLSVQVKGIQH